MRTAVLLAAMLGTLIAERPSLAQPAAMSADSKTVQACLDRLDASIGQNCIGVVAHPCITAAEGDSAKINVCAMRELRVWDAQLEVALRRIHSSIGHDGSGANVDVLAQSVSARAGGRALQHRARIQA